MNQQFEVKLLLKQNAEMVSKIQVYRRENQVLIQKNQDLNLWVQNLSEVFAAIGAAWKTITNNQQALFNLMKKRGDANSKSLISKYVSHFKTFDQIINRLGQKITNSGHSNEVTLDAKTRLNAFVQNYELFFKEIVDSYFKFNDEYLQWITQLKNKPELSQNFRNIANKEIQNKMKIKDFEGFMNQFRGRFKIYESQNQHKLLDGILFTKNQQINSLNQLNQKQTRRLNLIANYTAQNTQAILQAQQKDYECFCGGLQLQYFKKEWQHHLQQLRHQNDKIKATKSGQLQTNTSINREQLELIQFQKQKLFERISNLQGKIQKMKTQSRLTEDLVLNSSAYHNLYSQTEELVSFIDDLLNKINNHYTFLYEIEKARQEEILQLKNKLLKNESTTSISRQNIQSPQIKIQTNLIQFKTNITQWIKELKKEYVEINSKINTKEEALTKSKQFILVLQKQVDELNKKIDQLQSSKNGNLEFRHQKFNQVQKKVTDILNAISQTSYPDKNHIISIWKDFILYVKSRDKKIKQLQEKLKKKQKECSHKDKLLGVLQQGLKQTQTVYHSAQNQVKKFSDFITNTQKELHSLAQKNLSLRSQFEQQKILMNYKMKTENQSKIKMEQKLKSYEILQEQMKQVKKIVQQTQLSYENWIVQQQKKLMDTCLQLQQAKAEYELKRIESQEKDKTIKKVNEQKQKWKSECNKLGARFHAIQQKSQIGVLKVQLEEYKRKIMCNCSRDQQRSVVLKTCPHAFCKKCIQDMNNSRNRKCPLCGIRFGKTDIHDIILS